MKKAFFYGVLAALPILILEGLFRLLPVSNPPYLEPVTGRDPVVHYQRNVDYRYSNGWNFAIRARTRTNNYGYHHRSDYRPQDTTPLLMVVGDSFVEAQALDTGKSVADLLHATVADKGRVYGIGISGAPLSQYLAFAEFSRDTFRPRAMAFVIIGNDYDESLLKYKSEPRFHYFAEGRDGLELQRVDYSRSTVKTLLRESAFVRYVVLNVAPARIFHQSAQAEPADRIADSKRAVDYFLEQVPLKTGLAADAVVFVVDAVRPAMYSAETLRAAESGYESRMRQYFIEQAQRRGFTVLDLQPVFLRRHEQDGARFEFPTDGHWNELGHRVVAEEIRNTPLFARLFPIEGAH